jgi:hypothetical protein
MSLLWGKIEVPELTHNESRNFKPEDPTKPLGLFHHPTGLRLGSAPDLYEYRGDQVDYFLYGPEDEAWTLRVVTHDATYNVGIQTRKHLGLSYEEYKSLPVQDKIAREKEFMMLRGNQYLCSEVIPEGASPPARWSAERRDALVLMICFFKERDIYVSDPFPSTVNMRAEGIPESLRGTFRNPIWGRP